MSEQGPTTRDRDLGREGLEELAFRVIDAGGRPFPSALEPLDVLYWTMPDGSLWSASWVSGGQLVVRVVADRDAAINLVDDWLASVRHEAVVNLPEDGPTLWAPLGYLQEAILHEHRGDQ